MLTKDIVKIRQRIDKVDRMRVQRIKELKDTRNFKGMVLRWADDKTKPKILSDKQRMAIHYISDFAHNYSYTWIAAKLNVDISAISGWRNDPLFLRELDKEITRRRSFIRIHAFKNVHRAIMRGDMKATWNYLKMSGDLKENINIMEDRTGERELDDSQLKEEINKLQLELTNGSVPSSN